MIYRIIFFIFTFSILLNNNAYCERKSKNQRANFNTLFMLDYTDYDPAFNKGEADEDIFIRRARGSFKYNFSHSFNVKLQLDYNERKGELEEKEISLRYSGEDWAGFKIGKFKQPFGLEYQTSSSNLLAMERSIATHAFSLGRSYGAAIYSSSKRATFSIGIFDATDEEDLFDSLALTIRKTHAIKFNDDNIIHFGVSGSWRQGAEDRFQINERIEIYDAKSALESARFTADNIAQVCLESAWQAGGIILQGEYFSQEVKVKPSLAENDAKFSGYYLQSSYLFGGKHRYKKGRFRTLKPRRDQGNFELVFRASHVDAISQNRGHRADTFTLGFNYYINKSMRIMANYTYAELEGINAIPESDGNALSVRLQAAF